MTENEIDAQKAINGFLAAIRDAAAESPAFRARLIEAMQVTVLYEGQEQFQGANPAVQAARWSKDAFCRIWGAAKVGELKATLKENDLATATDMKGMKKNDLVELLYKRALSRAEELRLA
ncbi:hypothetical protein HY29_10860 [Hyphomonas beringensis]|uniref:Uncharacterized protein n=1 Tax=Hyphomonas beringensis TaxID=1280946 RepID=A0A062UBE1_9PROT|nr:hypothetical protein [Hyphomonas beringensis]KCZ55617.1 hypothetical protein HY29_10860 [Hyphomonas beringensis]